MTEHKHIYEALLAVYNKVGYVQKTGTNQAQNYKYAGEAAFIEALRPAMMENKIIVFPSGVKDKMALEIRKGDKVTINLNATYLYTFVHVPTNTSIVTEVSGEGSDPLDKGSYKAMTGAYKYALRQTFMIETGNDPENDSAQGFRTAKARTDFFKAVKDRIEKCLSLAELAEEWMCSQDDIQRLRNEDEQFFADLENTKNRMKKAFQDSQAMDARVPA